MHFTADCTLRCPFCYRHAGPAPDLPARPPGFFIDVIKHVPALAPQVALGGGEPLTNPGFVARIGRECDEHGVVLNVTTNGKLVRELPDGDLARAFEHVTMASVSFDTFKWGADLPGYVATVRRLKEVTGVQVGANLLVDESMFSHGGLRFAVIVEWLLADAGVDRVYSLYPKLVPFNVDLTRHAGLFHGLTRQHPSFYVDDLSKNVLEQGYGPWERPCHYGTGLVSIDELGRASGCSFETREVVTLREPADILQAASWHLPERRSCPFLVPPAREPNV